MKKNLLALAVILFAGITTVLGQNELIIDENFQLWESTEDLKPDPEDSCWVVAQEDTVYRELDIVTSSGLEQTTVTMIKVRIAPDCDSRRQYDGSGTNTEGVTTGWVELNKLQGDYANINDWELSEDTIGQFIFGPIPQIDSIRFAHSNTGSQRGIRIYFSFDGENWERPTDDEFWDCDDCQAGAVNTVEIFESDVYIMFTSGFKQSDGTSQYSRLHNIEVWGKPGELDRTGIHDRKVGSLNFVALGDNKYQIKGEIDNIQLFNTLGGLVNIVNANTDIIDLSPLSSGIYIFRATDKQGVEHIQKVFKY